MKNNNYLKYEIPGYNNWICKTNHSTHMKQNLKKLIVTLYKINEIVINNDCVKK